MGYQSFEDLEVWKRAMDQAVQVFNQMDGSRSFRLRNQMERSAVSVPSNIAEGQERDYRQDFIRFLRIAKGSNGELRTQVYLAKRLRILEEETAEGIVAESKEISSMLQGLIRSIEPA